MPQTLIPIFEPGSPYRRLARSLDALPNRFPPADDESDLRLLAKIFTPEEAELAAGLLPEPESLPQISERLGRDPQETTAQLKQMVKKGLIVFGKTTQGRPGFGLMPFVVGIYEAQAGRIDAEMAQLYEAYFQKSFGMALKIQPQVHRVIPVGVSIKNTMEVQPFECATALIDQAKAWGVLDCICRKQKALIGKPCGHPLDVCMTLSQKPDAFNNADSSYGIHSLTHEEAQETLQRASEAGLVHCVSNNQRDLWYICNCCTCSCGILRGMAELGIANVVAHSAFINRVDEELCAGCEDCLPACPFNALTMDGVAQVNEIRCVGCGVCVQVCPQGALGLERRPDASEPPLTEEDWRAARKKAANII
jgi:electron transport complex protein RnfB